MSDEVDEVRGILEAEGFKGVEITADDIFSDSQGVGGTPESESKAVAAPQGGVPAGGWLPWGYLQDEILEAYIDDEDEIDGENMTALAKRLRTSVEELGAIVQCTEPSLFETKRMEKLLERERLRHKDVSWDKLEVLALRKMTDLVETRKVTKVGELLAIAATANKAVRKQGSPAVSQYNQTNVFMAGGNQTAELPGPGGLGTMRLTLSPRTVQQLSQGVTIEAEVEKFSDGIEMLHAEDVPEINKLADSE